MNNRERLKNHKKDKSITLQDTEFKYVDLLQQEIYNAYYVQKHSNYLQFRNNRFGTVRFG